jgi:undecaprenyl-diphosphatase
MLLSVILLSIIEGITEFLPISSTGHLLIVSHWLPLKPSFYHVFDIAIQMGAIGAVVALYPRYFVRICKPNRTNINEWLCIACAILPLLIVGYLYKDFIKGSLFAPVVIYWGLLIGGIILIICDFVIPERGTSDTKSNLSLKQALIIGCVQVVSLWPGMSRSAATIVGGLGAGLNRVTAASFSFIIAVPIMVVVTGYDLMRARNQLSLAEYGWTALGMVLSFGVAWVCMRWFLGFVQHKGLAWFGVYRIIVGGLGLLFLV